MSNDLDEPSVTAVLPDRPVRVFPALVSTEADAIAWARSGAADGSVVVADYQAAARGRAGWPWRVQQGEGLGFSMVLRPRLGPRREGWLYTAAVLAVAEVLDDVTATNGGIRWPDEVVSATGREAVVACRAELFGVPLPWAVVSVLVEHATPPRTPLLARLVSAVEGALAEPAADVLQRYRRRCRTLGVDVVARLVPLGPAGVVVAGTAVDVKDDGSLVVRDSDQRRIAVLPQHLGLLEPA